MLLKVTPLTRQRPLFWHNSKDMERIQIGLQLKYHSFLPCSWGFHKLLKKKKLVKIPKGKKKKAPHIEVESQQRCAPHITLSQRWGGSVTPGGLHAGLGGHGEETEGRGKGYFPALPSHPEINPAWQPRGAVHYSPGSVLRAAVDVGPVLEEMSHDAQPASGTGLVQGTITRIVTMVYITDLVFQTIQNHFLEIGEKRKNIHRVICYCRAAARASLRKRGAGGQEAKHRLPTTCPSTPLDTDQPKKKKKRTKGKAFKAVFVQEAPRLSGADKTAARHREPHVPWRGFPIAAGARGHADFPGRAPSCRFSTLPRVKAGGRFLL